LAALLWALAGLAFCLPSAIDCFVDDAVGRSILLLGESFALLLVGLLAKRKGLLAVASTFVIIAGLRMVFQNPALILPAFVVVSALLIGVGLAVLLWQGMKRRGLSAPSKGSGPEER
jgi:hypothetical protein